MTVERLDVVYAGTALARLERDDDRLTLTYDPDVAANAFGAPLISVSLPVRSDPYEGRQLVPFFDGLLPEGATRDRLARRLRLEPGDVFGLLREIGRDCAGALSIIPTGTDPEAAAAEGVQWLSPEELADVVANLGDRPLGVETSEDIRISLAGVQDKLAVAVDTSGRIGLPRGTTPSTHILKPASVERRGRRSDRLAYPALVANEAMCLTLAGEAGIEVPELRVLDVDGELALLIARYDRRNLNGRMVRVHQEDFCQALGIPSRQKYQADGGPGLGAALDLIRRYSSQVSEDTDGFVDRVAFNYLVGNCDAHAKNFSLLYAREGTLLAPAYDLLSTEVYDHLSRKMAMSIDNVSDPTALKAVNWKNEVTRLDLSGQRYDRRIADLAERVLGALPSARSWAVEHALDDPLLSRVGKLVTERARTLVAEVA